MGFNYMERLISVEGHTYMSLARFCIGRISYRRFLGFALRREGHHFLKESEGVVHQMNY